MSYGLLTELGITIGLVAVLVFLYEASFLIRRLPSWAISLYLGIAFATSAIFNMAHPISLAEGVFIDGRMIVLALAAILTPTGSALLVTGAMLTYRIVVGGAGTAAGIAIILGAAALGFACRTWIDIGKRPYLPKFLLVGLGLSAVNLGASMLLPAEVRESVFHRIVLTTPIAYPLAMAVVGGLMAVVAERQRFQDAIVANEHRLSGLFEHNPVSIWEEDFSQVYEALQDWSLEDLEAIRPDELEKVQDLFAKIRIIDVNQAAVRLAGAGSKEELVARLPETTSPDSAFPFVGELIAMKKGDLYYRGEGNAYDLQGHKQRIDLHWQALTGPESSYDRVLVSSADITEQKALEARLREWVAEKDLLIREIHHRVKNNLSVMYSLISFEARKLGEEGNPTARTLTTMQNKILSMSMVYERLYEQKGFLEIETSHYIRALVAEILESLGASRIHCEPDIEEATLHVDLVIPLGLVINELLTNVVKYAYPRTQGGEARVIFHRVGDNYELTVEDDGVGMDLDMATGEAGTGLVLVRGLCDQLGGELLVNRSKPGHSVTLRFPVED